MQNIFKLKAGSIDALPSLVGSDTTSIVPALCFMKEIPLNHGRIALVDDSNFNWLMLWKWYAKKNGPCYYATRRRRKKETGKPVIVKMHREVLKISHLPHLFIDHKDGNGLNNCVDNLRIATQTDNHANRKPYKRNTSSIYKGVYFDRANNKWHARVSRNRKHFNLGRFVTEKEAAEAYNIAALRINGEFARINVL